MAGSPHAHVNSHYVSPSLSPDEFDSRFPATSCRFSAAACARWPGLSLAPPRCVTIEENGSSPSAVTTAGVAVTRPPAGDGEAAGGGPGWSCDCCGGCCC